MKIAEMGKEMYSRLRSFFEHFNDMGKALAGGVEAFNKMRRSASSRLIPQVKRFHELNLGSEMIDVEEQLNLPEDYQR
jgi:DNA anti-recombination protein RmuC